MDCVKASCPCSFLSADLPYPSVPPRCADQLDGILVRAISGDQVLSPSPVHAFACLGCRFFHSREAALNSSHDAASGASVGRQVAGWLFAALQSDFLYNSEHQLSGPTLSLQRCQLTRSGILQILGCALVMPCAGMRGAMSANASGRLHLLAQSLGRQKFE